MPSFLTPLQAQALGAAPLHAGPILHASHRTQSLAEKLKPYIQGAYGYLADLHALVNQGSSSITAGNLEKLIEAVQTDQVWATTGSLGKALKANGGLGDPSYLALSQSLADLHDVVDAMSSQWNLDAALALQYLQYWQQLVLSIGKG